MRWVAWVAAGVFACGGSPGAPASGDGGSGSITGSDAGPADAGSGSDAGPADAGYSGPDCTGIVPATSGSGITFDVPAGACSFATSDGRGAIAALGDQPARCLEYDVRGTFTGNFDSPIALPQATGFIAV